MSATNPRGRSGQSVEMLPIGLFGAVLGTVGLGLVWLDVARVFAMPEVIGGALIVLGCVVLAVVGTAYGVKCWRHWGLVRAEYRNPAQAGHFSAIPIAVLLLAAAFIPYDRDVANWLWWPGALALGGLAALLLSRLLRGGFDLEAANGSWLIGMVSPIVVPLAGVPLGHPEISQFLLVAGFAMWGVLFTLILARGLARPALAPALRPTWFILLVPPSIIFVSYLALTGGRVDFLATSLYYLTLFLTAAVLIAVRDFYRWPFTPAWWSFTFPSVAVALACVDFHEAQPSLFSLAAAIAGIALTTFVVAMVWALTLRAFWSGKLLAAPAAPT